MEAVADILREELETLKEEIIQAQKDAPPLNKAPGITAKTRGAWSSGKTAAGYEVITGTGDDNRGFLSGYAYVGAMETGRKAGKIPEDFNRIILRWAKTKGIEFEGSSDPKVLARWAAGVAWKIARKGNLANPRRLLFDKPIENFTERLTKRLGAFYEVEVKNEIFNF